LYFYFWCFTYSKKTLDVCKNSNNEAIIQVKKNQETFYKDCEFSCSKLKAIDVYESFDRGHNRIEKRKVELFKGAYFSTIDFDKWRSIEIIIRLTRHRSVFNTKTRCYDRSIEICYYVSTFSSFSAKSFCEAIRSHWSIENSNHYVRDVDFEEDKSRIRVNPFNMFCLRSFSLNIMRYNDVSNIKNERYKNAINIERIFKYKGIWKN